MWFYFGIFTALLSLVYFIHRKLQIKSFLQLREKNLIPVSNANGKYRYNLVAAYKEKPAYGYLEIDCATNLQFLARHETSDDVWAKSIGLSHECQTGKESFDSHIYLASITQEDAEVLGNDDEAKKLIRSLLSDLSSTEFTSNKFYEKNEINCDGKSLYLRIAFRIGKNQEKSEQIVKKLSALRLLANKLESYKPSSEHFWKVPAQRNTAIILGTSTALASVGAMEFFRFIIFRENQLFHPFSFLPTTFIISTFGIICLIFFVLKFVKKSARKHMILFEVCIFGFIGLLFTTYGFIYDINTEFDKSKSQIVNYKILEKYTERHRTKRGSYLTYHLLLENASEPVSSSIKISSGLYDDLSKSDFVTISIKQGFLKAPWQEYIQKCNSCSGDF
jgi:hypothetical protein